MNRTPDWTVHGLNVCRDGVHVVSVGATHAAELDAHFNIVDAALAWFERRVVRDDDDERRRHPLMTRQYEEGELFSAVDHLRRLNDARSGDPK